MVSKGDHCLLNYWDQWFFDGFSVIQPLVTMFLNGCQPLVQRCDGNDTSLRSSEISSTPHQLLSAGPSHNHSRTVCPWFLIECSHPTRIYIQRRSGYRGVTEVLTRTQNPFRPVFRKGAKHADGWKFSLILGFRTTLDRFLPETQI